MLATHRLGDATDLTLLHYNSALALLDDAERDTRMLKDKIEAHISSLQPVSATPPLIVAQLPDQPTRVPDVGLSANHEAVARDIVALMSRKAEAARHRRKIRSDTHRALAGGRNPSVQPPLEAAATISAAIGDKATRIIGMQLQAEVLEVAGLNAVSAQDGLSRVYATLSANGVTRRTSVRPRSMTLTFLTKNIGISFCPSSLDGVLANASLPQEDSRLHTACAILASTFPLAVNQVDGICLAEAIDAEGALRARCLTPGLLLVGVNEMSLADYSAAEASAVLAQALQVLPEEVDPFSTVTRKVQLVFMSHDDALPVHTSSSALNLFGSLGAGSDTKVHFGETLLFGEHVPPPTAPPQQWLHHYMKVKEGIQRLCSSAGHSVQIIDTCPAEPFLSLQLFQRVLPVSDEHQDKVQQFEEVTQTEQSLFGDDLMQSFVSKPVSGQQQDQHDSKMLSPQDEGAQRVQNDAHSLKPLYNLLGLKATQADAADASVIGEDDVLLGIRGFIPVPYPGMVLDRWLAIEPLTATGLPSASAGAPTRGTSLHGPTAFLASILSRDRHSTESSEGPSIRVRLRWVPLMAPKAAARSVLATAEISGFGFSLVDKDTEELLYTSLNEIKLDFHQYNTGRMAINARIHRLQIDCQLRSSLHPVVLAPVFPEGKKDITARQQDTLGVAVVLAPHPTITYIEDVSLLLTRLAVELDDEVLGAVLKFVSSLDFAAVDANDDLLDALNAVRKKTERQSVRIFSSRLLQTTNTTLMTASSESEPAFAQVTLHSESARATVLAIQEQIARSIVAQAPAEGEQLIYIGMLRLHPIAVEITFALSGETRFLSDLLPDIPIFGYAKNMIDAFGSTVANIDKAPISLASLFAQHVFESTDMLTSRMVNHYVQGAIREWYKVVGSAEFLGNPVGLVGGMGRDVMRLLYEPAAGLLDTPSEFGVTIASNAYALVRNTTVGVVGSASKVLGSVSKGMKKLTLEDLNDLEKLKRLKAARLQAQPQNIGEGLLRGGVAAIQGLAGGVLGIVVSPVRGFRRGFVGGLRGAAGGVIGVVVKPVAGAIDGTVFALQGIANNIAAKTKISCRERLPRYIAPDTVLTPFTSKDAEGGARLFTLQARGAARNHAYVYFADVASFRTFSDSEPSSLQQRAVRDLQNQYMSWASKFSRGHEAVHVRQQAKVVGTSTSCQQVTLKSLDTNRDLAIDYDPEMGCLPATVQRVERIPPALVHSGIKTLPLATSKIATASSEHEVEELFFTPIPAAEAEAIPSPYVVLVTDQSLFLLHDKTNDIILQMDLYQLMAESSIAAVASPSDAASPSGLRVHQGLLTAASHVVAGVGKGVNFVAKFAGVGGNTNADELEGVALPLVTMTTDGPVLLISSKHTHNTLAVLCSSAEDVTTMKKIISLASRKMCTRSHVHEIEDIASSRKVAEMKTAEDAAVASATLAFRQRRLAAAARETRFDRILSAVVFGFAQFPTSHLRESLPLTLIPERSMVSGISLLSADQYYPLFESAAGSAVSAVSEKSHQPMQAFCIGVQIKCLPHPDNLADFLMRAHTTVKVTAVARTYDDFARLWKCIPAAWHNATMRSQFVPRLPERRVSGTSPIRSRGIAPMTDGNGSVFMLEAMSQALNQLVRAVHIEEVNRKQGNAAVNCSDATWRRLRVALDAFLFGSEEERAHAQVIL
jgi:hypothetical protein